jgi:hypothetical protein
MFNMTFFAEAAGTRTTCAFATAGSGADFAAGAIVEADAAGSPSGVLPHAARNTTEATTDATCAAETKRVFSHSLNFLFRSSKV